MALLTDVLDIIDRWRPGDLPSEKDFERSLEAALARYLPPSVTIEPQWRHEGRTIDLFLEEPRRMLGLAGGGRVWIELKRDLRATTEYDRMIGQVVGMLQVGCYPLVLVVCGDNDARLVERLESHRFDELNWDWDVTVREKRTVR